jgi:predicted transcriptional regulator of viral defense system
MAIPSEVNRSQPTPCLATLSFMSTLAVEDMPPIFTHAAARALGVSDRALYHWRDIGVIEHLARGIFVQPGLPADPDLVEVAVRAPDATLCLTTALARHNLIDDIPPTINVALPRQQRPPRTTAPVTWHRFDDRTFTIGSDTITVYDDLKIGIYNPARSVVDAFRLRHLYGEDQAVEALRRWIVKPGNQPSELLELARHFPTAEPPLRRVLQVLL